MQRSAYLDNLKFVLMFLVVLGHCLEKSGVENALLFLIYVFHMPAFVFLAGVTSKADGIFRQIRPVLLIYAVFQVAYSAALIIGWRASWGLIVTPYWVLWFLLALVWWKLALPITRRSGLWIPLSVVLAIVAGYSPLINRTLTFSRALMWWPFFLAGFLDGKRILSMLERTNIRGRVTAAAVVVGSYVACMRLNVSHTLLYESYPYVASGIGPVFRLQHLIAAALLTTAVCILIPRSKCWMTRYGQCTLALLVLHPAPLLLLRPVLGRMHNAAVSLVAAVLITALCGHPKAELLVRKIGSLGGTARRDRALVSTEHA